MDYSLTLFVRINKYFPSFSLEISRLKFDIILVIDERVDLNNPDTYNTLKGQAEVQVYSFHQLSATPHCGKYPFLFNYCASICLFSEKCFFLRTRYMFELSHAMHTTSAYTIIIIFKIIMTTVHSK